MITNKHYTEFINRLEEIDLIKNRDFTIEKLKSDNEYKIDIGEVSSIRNQRANRLRTHAVMGMIYHFKNRKWIIDDSYIFICKSDHIITFNDGSVETI